jgi:hypothetical protein
VSADRRNRLPSSARRGAARARLASALATLTGRTAHKPLPATVTELCRLANVSRNSLYRYHAPILAALRQHQSPKSARDKALHSAEQRRRENLELHQRLAKLAALVDHYFTAYRETAALLARRERELAEVRGKLASRPTVLSIHDRTHTSDKLS